MASVIQSFSTAAERLFGYSAEEVRGEVARQPENGAKSIEEASALALVGAKERCIKVLIGTGPSLPRAVVDCVQIQQVLLNLIRNAVEAMDGREVRELPVGTSQGTGLVLVSVADTGGGDATDRRVRGETGGEGPAARNCRRLGGFGERRGLRDTLNDLL